MAAAITIYRSSIGKKAIMAITGLIGIGFLADLPQDEGQTCLAHKCGILQGKIAQFEEMAGRVALSDATHLTIRRALHRLRADEAWLDEVGIWLRRQQTESREA